MEKMYAYHWPGNIRELENIIEQSTVLNDGRSKLQLKRTLNVYRIGKRSSKTIVNTLEEVKQIQQQTERDYITSILKKTKGRHTRYKRCCGIIKSQTQYAGNRKWQSLISNARLYRFTREFVVRPWCVSPAPSLFPTDPHTTNSIKPPTISGLIYNSPISSE